MKFRNNKRIAKKNNQERKRQKYEQWYQNKNTVDNDAESKVWIKPINKFLYYDFR